MKDLPKNFKCQHCYPPENQRYEFVYRFDVPELPLALGRLSGWLSYKCLNCEYTFEFWDNLTCWLCKEESLIHEKDNGMDITQYYCEHCKMTFFMEYHFRKGTVEGPWVRPCVHYGVKPVLKKGTEDTLVCACCFPEGDINAN